MTWAQAHLGTRIDCFLKPAAYETPPGNGSAAAALQSTVGADDDRSGMAAQQPANACTDAAVEDNDLPTAALLRGVRSLHLLQPALPQAG